MIYKCTIEKNHREYEQWPAPVSYADIEMLIEADSIISATKKFAKELGGKYGTWDYSKLIVELVGSLANIDD